MKASSLCYSPGIQWHVLFMLSADGKLKFLRAVPSRTWKPTIILGTQNFLVDVLLSIPAFIWKIVLNLIGTAVFLSPSQTCHIIS